MKWYDVLINVVLSVLVLLLLSLTLAWSAPPEQVVQQLDIRNPDDAWGFLKWDCKIIDGVDSSFTTKPRYVRMGAADTAVSCAYYGASINVAQVFIIGGTTDRVHISARTTLLGTASLSAIPDSCFVAKHWLSSDTTGISASDDSLETEGAYPPVDLKLGYPQGIKFWCVTSTDQVGEPVIKMHLFQKDHD